MSNLAAHTRLSKALLLACCLACVSGFITTTSADSGSLKAFDLHTIEQQLANSESRFSDLVENTNKTVRWFNGKQKTAIAIVYLHGFSASRQELSPVTEKLADRLGANIYFARLRGHGRSDDAMAEATRQDWLDDTHFAYQVGELIGERVVLLSASTGSTLAMWLSAQDFAKNLYANVMISPNFGIKSRTGEIARWGWGLQLAKWLNGPYRSFQPNNEIHAKYWTERYPIEAVVPMIKLVDQVVDMEKDSITAPQLIIYSPDDQVINVGRIPLISEQINNAAVSIIPFANSSDPAQHVLAGDACSPDTTDQMVELIFNYLQNLS